VCSSHPRLWWSSCWAWCSLPLPSRRSRRGAAPVQGYAPEPGHSVVTDPAPTRKGGRPRSPVGQQILDLLAAHPEGLSAEQLRGALTPRKPLGDTLAGMRRLGTVRTEGAGRALRYFAALDGGAAVRAAEPDGPAP
jgi:hypothetical protein